MPLPENDLVSLQVFLADVSLVASLTLDIVEAQRLGSEQYHEFQQGRPFGSPGPVQSKLSGPSLPNRAGFETGATERVQNKSFTCITKEVWKQDGIVYFHHDIDY